MYAKYRTYVLYVVSIVGNKNDLKCDYNYTELVLNSSSVRT